MILSQFPDLQWLKSQASTRFANRKGLGGVQLENLGWPTVVMNARASNVVRDNIQGPLSIFTNLTGSSEVVVDKRRVTISSETFFISNTGQSYTLEVQQNPAIETFNIHFGEYFVEKALPGFFATPEQLLENKSQPHKDFGFHNRLTQSSEEFLSVINSIRLNGGDNLLLEEKLFQLLGILLRGQQNVNAMHDRLADMKSSTKDEVVKRLLITTDYLYTFYHRNPTLDDLASVSCLSKFHFLRLFKAAYGQTPHQFITELKIKRAKELLQNTAHDVKVIADKLGFDNASTFSRLFHHQLGVYPTEFRATC